tara:strand:- start:16503 stop:16850 length:348 start_codon:yes stop_codon:yes gene_type:complete
MNSFQNLKAAETRRMWFIFLAFLVSGIIGLGVGLGLYFYVITGTVFATIIALLCVYFFGMKLTALVDAKVKISCPICSASELEENYTLQCRPAEYECNHCNSVYRDGVLVEKESP